MGEIIPHSLNPGPVVHYYWAKCDQLLLLSREKKKQSGRGGRKDRGVEGTEQCEVRGYSEGHSDSISQCHWT